MSRFGLREAYARTPRVLHWRRGHKAERLERITQIEVRAFEKLQKRMRELAAERGMVPVVN